MQFPFVKSHFEQMGTKIFFNGVTSYNFSRIRFIKSYIHLGRGKINELFLPKMNNIIIFCNK